MDTKSRYGLALALLLFAYLVDAFNGRGVELIVALVFVGLLMVLVFDREARPVVKVIGVLLIFFSVTTSIAAFVAKVPSVGESAVGALSSVADTLVLAWGIVIVLVRIVRNRTITLSTVMGGVLVYTLMGFLFAAAYLAINYVTGCTPDGTCGFFAQPDVTRSEFQYFSFVVLTTLGFGDLTPGTDFGQRVVVIEALLAQVFLVVFVARLVSLWGTTRMIVHGDSQNPEQT